MLSRARFSNIGPTSTPASRPLPSFSCLGELDGRLGELLLHVLVDVEPARGDADLAVVAELADDGDLGPDFRDRRRGRR